MPCCTGQTPVIKVVWLGYVMVGVTPVTPSAYVPSATNRRRFGILSPCSSARVTESGRMPSIEISRMDAADKRVCVARASARSRACARKKEADEGVGRGPGGPPHFGDFSKHRTEMISRPTCARCVRQIGNASPRAICWRNRFHHASRSAGRGPRSAPERAFLRRSPR